MEEENGRALGHWDKMGFDGKDFEQNMCAHGLKKQDDEHDSRKRNTKQKAEAKTGG